MPALRIQLSVQIPNGQDEVPVVRLYASGRAGEAGDLRQGPGQHHAAYVQVHHKRPPINFISHCKRRLCVRLHQS